MKECLIYEKNPNGTVRCAACHHACLIADGRTGICGVRQNIGGRLFLLAYGRAAALNSDPVEKKPLFHFLPGTKIMSFGTLGCNLRCANCQNFDISQIHGLKGRVGEYAGIDWGQVFTPAQVVELALGSGCRSIAYTYNEPTVWLEYALDTMKLAKSAGLKNAWVSNGYMSDAALDLIVPHLDAINIDLKSIDHEFYTENCGAVLEPILRNCRRFVQAGVWTEITTLLIPTMSDNPNMLERIADFIKSELGDFVPWHVTAFSGAISWKLKYLPDTFADTVQQAYRIGKSAGLKYVYAGNIWEKGFDLENTYCPGCGHELIARTGYQIIRRDTEGACPNCAERIEGIFS